jgi:hypothetical protein
MTLPPCRQLLPSWLRAPPRPALSGRASAPRRLLARGARGGPSRVQTAGVQSLADAASVPASEARNDAGVTCCACIAHAFFARRTDGTGVSPAGSRARHSGHGSGVSQPRDSLQSTRQPRWNLRGPTHVKATLVCANRRASACNNVDARVVATGHERRASCGHSAARERDTHGQRPAGAQLAGASARVRACCWRSRAALAIGTPRR